MDGASPAAGWGPLKWLRKPWRPTAVVTVLAVGDEDAADAEEMPMPFEDAGGVAGSPSAGWSLVKWFKKPWASTAEPGEVIVLVEKLQPWNDVGFMEHVVAQSRELVEHVIAGYLSAWIYTDEPLQSLPCGGDDVVQLQLLGVYEDPVGGVTARLGAVAATFPRGGRVVYLVFKGTSMIGDFVADASFIPSYTPFDRTFQDNVTFVHQGTYHAIEQLWIRFSERILAVLQAEGRAGAERLIVTGHSLGGMYAKAFMLELFFRTDVWQSRFRQGLGWLWRSLPAAWPPALRRRARCFANEPLVRSARCVTFGAPSICGRHPSGGETKLRSDLAAFMRERAVNYVHEDDPYARAWQHVNLTELVEVMARDQLERIAGPKMSRYVLRHMFAQFLVRFKESLAFSGFQDHVVETTRHYQELSVIRFLTRRSFRDWRKLDKMIGSDHRMPEYMACLRDATYNGDASSQERRAAVFDESGLEVEWQ